MLLVIFIPWSAVDLADYFLVRRGNYDVDNPAPAPSMSGRASLLVRAGIAGPHRAAGVTPAPQTGVRMITVGGTAGWQIALIAAVAAVVAAAAVRLDRSLTARRAGLVIAARRCLPAGAAHHPGPTHRAASTRDASLPPAPASGTPDVVEFGSNLTG